MAEVTGVFKGLAEALLGGAFGGIDAAGGGTGDVSTFWNTLQANKAKEARVRQHAQLQTLMQDRGLLKPGEVLPMGMEDNPALLKMLYPPQGKATRLGKPGEAYLDPQGNMHVVPGTPTSKPMRVGTDTWVDAEGKVHHEPHQFAPQKPTRDRLAWSDRLGKVIDLDTGQAIAIPGVGGRPEKPPTGNPRLDKSYALQQTNLGKITTPLEQQAERMGRLIESVNQTTPQADALIAPELLTAMAGGQGSGLRMNEAEISRIVGGRTNWESLKAAVNKWQIDPTKGLSITPAQRQQVSALIRVINNRIQGKLAVAYKAYEKLADATTVEDQRKIVNKARRDISAVTNQASVAVPGGMTNSAVDDIYQQVPP